MPTLPARLRWSFSIRGNWLQYRLLPDCIVIVPLRPSGSKEHTPKAVLSLPGPSNRGAKSLLQSERRAPWGM
jgi:hypothetical protein